MLGKRNEIRITTIIGKDAECNGNFTSSGTVRVDGTLNGDLTVSETIILGATGVINGDITCKVAIIGGENNGSINAPEKTELTSTARVLGDITTTTIVIDEHAVFQGSCNMNQDVSSKRARPSSKAVRTGMKNARAAIDEALKESDGTSQEEGQTTGQNAGQTAGQTTGQNVGRMTGQTVGQTYSKE